MGCNPGAVGECFEDELPYHEVFLDAFSIGRTAVSQAEYTECVSAGMCAPPGGPTPFDTDCEQPVVGEAFPVTCVSWFSAQDYCQYRGQRLPTEAEWEKAARGENGNTYPWGNGDPNCNLAQYNDCGNSLEPADSNPGGASPYGALNMSGNVFEWVSDWYGATYYASSPRANPTGPRTGDRRATRSQAWNYVADYMRTSIRGPDYEAPAPEFGGPTVGIRCAATL